MRAIVFIPGLVVMLAIVSASCRGSRPVVADTDRIEMRGVSLTSETRPALAISAIALPLPISSYDYLELLLQDEKGQRTSFVPYQLNQAIQLEPQVSYQIELRAFDQGTVVASTRYCQAKLRVRSNTSLQTVTLSLCQEPR